ncbi:hypothetical protein G9A89_016989 [Geosiphon pyriformis]|nr:hypothetical protein G9A89_016989 [Geosiphon pyriformis]
MHNEIEQNLRLFSYEEGPPKKGWLFNMCSTTVIDPKKRQNLAAVDLYFYQEDLTCFKVTLKYKPYFYIACKKGTHERVKDFLPKIWAEIYRIEEENEKQDLQQPDHMRNPWIKVLKIMFHNVKDLVNVRNKLEPLIKKNKKLNASTGHDSDTERASNYGQDKFYKIVSSMTDIRESDVPYYQRVAIDKDIRVGRWYTVEARPSYEGAEIILKKEEDVVENPETVVLAFDIETYKDPLKFPDSKKDPIMMISYMIDGQGFLLTNREIISQDIEDFEYIPKPEFGAKFRIFNEANESGLLIRFFEHINRAKPHIIVTYNGDSFDWPYVAERAEYHSMKISWEIGFQKTETGNDVLYTSKHCVHMDCFHWVQRDSYLPAGSQGLKAVTKAKLGYDPLELDPEDMVPAACERPQELAQYSVSDAVATYYLYMEHIHSFIFSLCNLIPLNPDDVLRKGSGTLCEVLLMTEAYHAKILFPNKHSEDLEKWNDGNLIDSETYVGGHVEALEAGVFRSDIPIEFIIDHDSIQNLIENVDDILKFAIENEEKEENIICSDVINYNEVREKIVFNLQKLLKDSSNDHKLVTQPAIYHFDVGAMYPNIILTNRLQPDAIMSIASNAPCAFKVDGKSCDRYMEWTWRGEVFTANRAEVEHCRRLLEQEIFDNAKYSDLPQEKQSELLKKRVQEYGRSTRGAAKETKLEQRKVIVCQRENSFYVNTVRNFRDERYKYKRLLKEWKKKLHDAGKRPEEFKIARNRIVLYDSLQIAHKCILNSFYGYVMRKGSRWYSMEMAGVVCLTGAKIIQMAKKWVETIGRPLELDTDGIWCMLPSNFPRNFSFNLFSGKSLTISYPCVVLNHLVRKHFTNDQFFVLKIDGKYEVRSENTIFFEPDGPYRAMILPASEKADKKLKKRYAVFNEAGKLVELKGFEVKRRGELKLIKVFQKSIFPLYLKGTTLEQSYAAVAEVANKWLDVLESKGKGIDEVELIDLICEGKNMSRTLEDYGDAKSTQITTARRLKEFLGAEMVQEKGLACKFIIGAKPHGIDVSQRAIPIAIFSADFAVKQHFLRKWLNDPSLQAFDIREIVDWHYYSERLKRVMQKQIAIPAVTQGLLNPIPRVVPPKWLLDAAKKDKQHRIDTMFQKAPKDLPLKQREHRPNNLSLPTDSSEQDLDGGDLMEVESERNPTCGNISSPKTKGFSGSEREAKKPKLKRKMKIESQYDENDVIHNSRFSDASDGPTQKKRARKRKSEKKGKSISVLDSFFTNKNGTSSQSQSDFLILQIVPTTSFGELRVFAFDNNRLIPITITILRKVYVNSRRPELSEDLRKMCDDFIKAKQILPGCRQKHHLFELSMKESMFQQNLNNLLRDPTLEGVYESKVPLVLQALTHVGFRCAIDYHGHLLNRKYNLTDFKKPKSKPHFNIDKLPFLYLIYITTSFGKIWGLFNSTKTNVQFFVEHRENSTSRIKNEKIEKIYEDIFQDIGPDENDIFMYFSMIKSVVKHYSDEEAVGNPKNGGLNTIKDILHEIREYRGPKLLVIQSKKTNPLGRLVSMEFPMISMHPPELNINGKTSKNWQIDALEMIFQNYFKVGPWVRNRINIGYYTDIPLCNLPLDWQLFAMDVQFSRILREDQHLLWWSPSPDPDFGGHEMDQYSCATDIYSAFEYNNPGFYKNMCIEFKLFHVLSNAILQHEQISMPEMPDALQSLKKMVEKWWVDASKLNEPIAAELENHFHRWLSSPQANLHDPRLYGSVKRLMTNVLWGLYDKLDGIVHADLGTIILSTSITDFHSLEEYIDSIKRDIEITSPLEQLTLKKGRIWLKLWWEDPMNYGGICIDNAGICKQSMQWNIATYLPIELGSVVEKIIQIFIEKTFELSNSADIEFDNDSESLTSNKYKAPFNQVISAIEMVIDRIHENQKNGNTFKFPEIPGATYKMENPALEFLKIVFKILGLDKCLQGSIDQSKARLMGSLDISAFSQQAKFQNPAGVVKIRLVSCTKCGATRDVDLCREFDLNKTEWWQCLICGKEYDRNHFERFLVIWLEYQIMAYQLAGFRCTRCMKEIKDLQENCDCGNSYRIDQDRQQLVEQLRVLKEVSHFKKMLILKDMTIRLSF